MENEIDFRGMTENKPFVNLRVAYDGMQWKTVYISKNVEQYGYSRDEFMSGKIGWPDMIHPDDRVAALQQSHDYVAKNLDDFRIDYRIVDAYGDSVYVADYSHINRGPDGSVETVDCALLDAVVLQGNGAAADNHSRQQMAINDILLSLHDADLDHSLEIILEKAGSYLNASRAALFRDSPDRKTCRPVCEWRNKGIASIMQGGRVLDYLKQAPEVHRALENSGLMLINAGSVPESFREGFERDGLVSAALFAVYLHGVRSGFVSFSDCVVRREWDEEDVFFLRNCANLVSTVLMRMHSEEKLHRQEAEIKRLAFTDHLTGLPNRHRCGEELALALEKSRASGTNGHLLFVDLDDFKIVNDCYGHDYGDGVLIGFSEFASEMFHRRGSVYRFGGDEFVILLPDCRKNELAFFLRRLLERARHPWRSLGRDFFCSLSIGVVEYSGATDDPRSVIKKADIAMYSAKKGGKNNFSHYAEGLDHDTLRRTEMESLLRNAMSDGFKGFVLHYQPYSATGAEHIVGAEALVRMKDADGSLLLPELFLPLAEYLGMIVPIGEFVLAGAAEQCRAVNAMKGHEDFSITVNMSSKQFKQMDIVQRSLDILADSGVDAGNMIMSINESSALNDHERMMRICKEFRRRGVRMALNDFGSGSASFINMRDLPVDIVNVSSKYVEDMGDCFTSSFLKLVTELGHSAGKKICMNGVEKAAEFAYCKEFGIDLVQGFLLHRPGDADTLQSILSKSLTRKLRRESVSR